VKEIKCCRCDKKVEVENTYPFKKCPMCRLRCKEKYRVKSVFDRESRKLIKSLKFEGKTSHMLSSFSVFAEEYEKAWHKKPTWEEYQKELSKAKQNEIYKKSDIEETQNRQKFLALKQHLRRFLRFDFYVCGNKRKECEKFRYQKLGLIEEDLEFTREHVEECSGECYFWNYNLETNQLSTIEGIMFTKVEKSDLPTECDTFHKMVNREIVRDGFFMNEHLLNCKQCQEWYASNKRSTPRGTDLWHSEETTEDKERQELNRKLYEETFKKPEFKEQTEPSTYELEKEKDLAEHETKRILKLPKDKLEEWLKQQEKEESSEN